MDTFTVRNGAWVVIGDGKKVLVLQNAGDAQLLNLRRISVREQNTSTSREQDSDASGRANSPIGERGLVGENDWHQIEEDRFAATIAEDLNRAAREQQFKELVVVAPPKTLAELRREWSKETVKRIVAEIPKDYTHHPIPEIEGMLLTHRPPVTVV